MTTGQVDGLLLTQAIDHFGRGGATEIVAIAGYYSLLAAFIKTAGFDQPFSD